MDGLILLHTCACAFMCGVIWIIQLVHYPAFEFVSEGDFVKSHRAHSSRITFVVAPMMILELISGGALLYLQPGARLFQLNFAGVLFTWLCTFALSVPRHNLLAVRKRSEVITSLVLTNWPRTLLWSGRLVLLASILIPRLGGLNL